MSSFPVAGVRVGHVTRGGSGVTVMLLPAGTVASGEVRGGAPATREIDLLDPARTVAQIDAVVFAGGSAFGLAAADGVMRYLAERGQGFPTAGGPVPIVPTACVYDLVDSGGTIPTADDGYAAAEVAARDEPLALGRVGSATSATVGKWKGRDTAVPGGIGLARSNVDGFTVAALAVVNAVGDIVGADGRIIAGSTAPADAPGFPTPVPFEEGNERGNTTLVALVTDAALDKPSCHLLAHSAHDGFARALHPVHTRHDGDLVVVAATGSVGGGVDAPVNVDRLRATAADVVADAIRSAPQ